MQKAGEVKLQLSGVRTLVALQHVEEEFHHDVIFESESVRDLLRDPGFYGVQADFAHVHLGAEVGGKFHGLQELLLLVVEASILIRIGPPKEPRIRHFSLATLSL